ncbi:MAG: hypothetical protein LC798_16100 [Chloroflexi bacterium]|nr:hypothetical protein [Chloroflexota bacterium]
MTEPETSASSRPSPSLRLVSAKPSAPPRLGSHELTGTLGFEDLEGGCVTFESQDATRYEVLYPEGWELQRSPLQLLSPDGEVVARPGDQITIRGSEATDMSSICQVGPIFRATEVVIP